MKRRKGFTLLELLIAATLLSILAAFAMGAYRRGLFQARLEDYKNRTRAAAYAVQAFVEDGGSLMKLAKSTKIESLNSLSHYLDPEQNYSPWKWSIIACRWPSEEGVVESEGEICKAISANDKRTLVCLINGKDSVPEEYENYRFCVSEIDEKEFFE